MAMTGTVEVDVEVKASPEKFWGAIRESNEIFPKAFPKQYKSIEVLEGDGWSVGSVRLIKYAEGIPFVTESKEKMEELDEEKKMVKYSVIDGELLQFLKTFKAKLVVEPKGEGSAVKWTLEYEKAKEEVPDPDLISEFATSNFKDLDAYLLNAAQA